MGKALSPCAKITLHFLLPSWGRTAIFNAEFVDVLRKSSRIGQSFILVRKKYTEFPTSQSVHENRPYAEFVVVLRKSYACGAKPYPCAQEFHCIFCLPSDARGLPPNAEFVVILRKSRAWDSPYLCIPKFHAFPASRLGTHCRSFSSAEFVAIL